MFPRPMTSNHARAIPIAPDQLPALSAVETQERLQLREAMRLRRSVDHFARAWYGAIASLILSGVAAKLFVDRPSFRWGLALVAGLGLAGWCFAIGNLLRSRRAARAERKMLVRLQTLDLRAPKPPELF